MSDSEENNSDNESVVKDDKETDTSNNDKLGETPVSGPKKRGRKPKIRPEAELPDLDKDGKQVEPVARRRGRKKKFQIESIKKLRDPNTEEDRVVFSTNNDYQDTVHEPHSNVSQISFGSLIVTKHNSQPVDKHELRKMFNDDFELSPSEKVSNVLLQEQQNKKTVKDTVDIINKKDVNNHEDSSEDDLQKSNSAATKTNFVKKIHKKKVYKVLDHFINEMSKESKWPSKTSVWCWWCCHPFDTQPIPCPINYDKIHDRFEVKGVFCSIGCCAAYSVENYKSLTHVYTFNKRILKETDHDTISSFKTAPSKTVLKVFGGHMSIEEFRSYSDPSLISETSEHWKDNHVINLSTDNISYINQQILEEYTDNKLKIR
jgi:hypothetical protein